MVIDIITSDYDYILSAFSNKLLKITKLGSNNNTIITKYYIFTFTHSKSYNLTLNIIL